MGLPQTSSITPSPHLYSQELQLKLYQAFIFSIPILFSIILFLLFYLFYLKRRASTIISSTPQVLLPITSPNQVCQMGMLDHEKLRNKLPIVLFDEDLRSKESQCCVCLGEFEIKEELLQIPLCKHVFHIDCIHHWLHSSSTCPLCRCLVMIPTTTTTTKLEDHSSSQFNGPQPPYHENSTIYSNQHMQIGSTSNTTTSSSSIQQIVVPIDTITSST